MNTENSTRSESATPGRGDALEDVRTVVVKVGTNVLSRPDGDMALGRIHGLIENLADLRRRGIKVILVSSGAISMGMNRLEYDKRPTSLQDKQACAAIGQIQLMAVYQQGFDRYQLPTAQLLLTEDDFASRTRYLNLRNTMFRLLEMGVLPIVNENDSISTSEIEEPGAGKGAVFGDNDELSALVASKLDADLLLLLTDVNGLYSSSPNPGNGEDEKPLSIVREITDEITAMAEDNRDERSRGGMTSKLQAITIAVQSGIPAVIANGLTADVVRDVLAGEDAGTLFLPGKRLKSRKRWIAYASSTTASRRSTREPGRPSSSGARACCSRAPSGSREISTGATSSASSTAMARNSPGASATTIPARRRRCSARSSMRSPMPISPSSSPATISL